MQTAALLVGDQKPTIAIAIALITGVGSLLVAVTSQVLARRANTNLELLKSQLEEQGKERDARRDYEYEARKRLYEQCEPLLFQMVELAAGAHRRIVSIARSSRNGDLQPDGSGWLADSGYYYTSTVFLLLAPATTFKILQRRLTAIDLSLEPTLREQYEILRLLFLSWASDFDVAELEPKLTYDPDRTDPDRADREELLRDHPGEYARQGLYRGMLDVVTNALIYTSPKPSNGQEVESRCMTFGEFLADFADPKTKVGALCPEFEALFKGFHPRTKPVLWRVLLTQELLYREFLKGQTALLDDDAELEDAFDWRHDDDGTVEEVNAAVAAATVHVGKALARVQLILRTAQLKAGETTTQ